MEISPSTSTETPRFGSLPPSFILGNRILQQKWGVLKIMLSDL